MAIKPKHYETLYLVRPDLSSEDLTTIQDKVTKAIKSGEGEITKDEKWAERDLAYPINDFTRGTYYIVEFKALPNVIASIEKHLAFHNTDVLRFMTINVEEPSANAAEAPAASTSTASTPKVSTTAASTATVSTPKASAPTTSTSTASTPKASAPSASTATISTPKASTPPKSAPEETTPVETTPAEVIPPESAPEESTPVEDVPAESAPADTAPAEDTPAESTPVDTTPAEDNDSVSDINSDFTAAQPEKSAEDKESGGEE